MKFFFLPPPLHFSFLFLFFFNLEIQSLFPLATNLNVDQIFLGWTGLILGWVTNNWKLLLRFHRGLTGTYSMTIKYFSTTNIFLGWPCIFPPGSPSLFLLFQNNNSIPVTLKSSSARMIYMVTIVMMQTRKIQHLQSYCPKKELRYGRHSASRLLCESEVAAII